MSVLPVVRWHLLDIFSHVCSFTIALVALRSQRWSSCSISFRWVNLLDRLVQLLIVTFIRERNIVINLRIHIVLSFFVWLPYVLAFSDVFNRESSLLYKVQTAFGTYVFRHPRNHWLSWTIGVFQELLVLGNMLRLLTRLYLLLVISIFAFAWLLCKVGCYGLSVLLKSKTISCSIIWAVGLGSIAFPILLFTISFLY